VVRVLDCHGDDSGSNPAHTISFFHYFTEFSAG
jgi:hypothetical protein